MTSYIGPFDNRKHDDFFSHCPDDKFVSYSKNYDENPEEKYYAYRITKDENQINYVIAIRTRYGYTTEGYLYYNDHDGKAQKVYLFSLCLKQSLKGMENVVFLNRSSCNIAYFHDGKIFVNKGRGYELEEVHEASVVDTSTAAIAVKSEIVLMYRMVLSSKSKECSNGGDVKSDFSRPCSENHVLLKYDKFGPIGILIKRDHASKYLVVFVTKSVALVLDGNFISCGYKGIDCVRHAHRTINYVQSISYQNQIHFLANEVVTVHYTTSGVNYMCVKNFLSKSTISECKNFKFKDGTLYLAFGVVERAICNFRPFGFTLLNGYLPISKC